MCIRDRYLTLLPFGTVGESQLESGVVREAIVRTTVLVIDDEQNFHDIIARYLVGFRVINAYNGRQGMAALAQYHVDVVLLDLNLPDTQGMILLDPVSYTHLTLPTSDLV